MSIEIEPAEHPALEDLLRQRRSALIAAMRACAERTGILETGHVEMLAAVHIALQAIEADDL